VHLGLPENIGASKRGFRSAYFTLDIDAEVLSQAGWQTALKHLWHSLSHVLQPFYGDVRTLTGYRRNRVVLVDPFHAASPGDSMVVVWTPSRAGARRRIGETLRRTVAGVRR